MCFSSVSAKNVTFNLGIDTNLTCGNKTWDEIVYVIWNIILPNNHKSCQVGLNDEGQVEDTCKDGKVLRNTSESQSYLHIPNFSNSDVGFYKCELVYNGGCEIYILNVDIIGNLITLRMLPPLWMKCRSY